MRMEAEIPRFWNYPHNWKFDVSGRKISVFYLFPLKKSFLDIMNDFGSKERNDLLKFVPMRYVVNFDLDKVEAVFPVHQNNWLTNARFHHKNTKRHKEAQSNADINEDLLNSNSFQFVNAQKVTGIMDLNFLEFCPEMLHHVFTFEASNLDLSYHLPDSFPSKHIVKSLALSMKDLTGFDIRTKPSGGSTGMDNEMASGDGLGATSSSTGHPRSSERFYTFPNSDAIEVVHCGSLSLTVDHKYHPVLYNEHGNVSGANISLPKRTPKLSMRKMGMAGDHSKRQTYDQVSISNSNAGQDPASAPPPKFMSPIKPDLCEITVAFDNVTGVVYGIAIKHLIAFVKNVFTGLPVQQFERKSTDRHQSTNKKRHAATASPTNHTQSGLELGQSSEDAAQVV